MYEDKHNARVATRDQYTTQVLGAAPEVAGVALAPKPKTAAATAL